MKYVYVVTAYHFVWEDTRLVGVFKTNKMAEEFASYMNNKSEKEDFNVHEEEIIKDISGYIE